MRLMIISWSGMSHDRCVYHQSWLIVIIYGSECEYYKEITKDQQERKKRPDRASNNKKNLW